MVFSKLFKKKQVNGVEISSPLTGEAVSLEKVPDEAFATKCMGDGLAIEPTEGKLVAPFSGTVAHVIKSKHAVILEHDSGLQLLMHIGINTVSLKGEGFTTHVDTGDKVKAGQLLIEFDLDLIKRNGLPTITPLVIANSDDFTAEYTYKPVQAGDPALIKATKK